MVPANDPSARYPTPEPVPTEPHASQLVIRKSRFLAQSFYISSAADAREGILEIDARHPGATHNCWAFVAGPPGSTNDIGYSDDGEPHGTAGKPILNALLHSGIGKICMVITRWFGGIKLGTGGLSRAYQQAALENLQSLACIERVPLVSCQLRLPYTFLEGVRQSVQRLKGIIHEEEFTSDVTMQVGIALDKEKDFFEQIRSLSRDAIQVKKISA